MAHLHKADLCVNHTMSVKIAMELGGESNRPSLGPSKIFTKFLAYLEPPDSEEKSVESFYANAIRGHACTISSVVNNGKRYVWWRNPWGFHDDVKEWAGKQGHQHYNSVFPSKIQNSKIKDVKENVIWSDKPLREHVKIGAVRARLEHMLLGDKERASDVNQKLNVWSCRGHPHISDPLPELHVMQTLQLLKLMTDADHIVVIHPSKTMPAYGPQQSDGIDCDMYDWSDESVGACVLWSEVYMKKVERVVEEFLAKPIRSEYELLQMITNKICYGHLGGEKSTPLALARYMDLHGDALRGWKTILSIVYDVIPEKERDRKVTRYSSSSRFNSNWHVETLWKLDLVAGYIETKIKRDTSVVTGPRDFLPEIVAGFIESINVVASVQARAQPAYLETLGHIATFVEKHRLNNKVYLKEFISMLKLLISCKHNEDILGNVGAEKQVSNLHTLTRAEREKGKAFLQEHAALYGYGASNGIDFVEDTRKKRRRTSKMFKKPESQASP